MTIFGNERAQASIELLLLLGGAIVVAFSVGLAVKSMLGESVKPAVHESLGQTIHAS